MASQLITQIIITSAWWLSDLLNLLSSCSESYSGGFGYRSEWASVRLTDKIISGTSHLKQSHITNLIFTILLHVFYLCLHWFLDMARFICSYMYICLSFMPCLGGVHDSFFNTKTNIWSLFWPFVYTQTMKTHTQTGDFWIRRPKS